jgi:transketolase
MRKTALDTVHALARRDPRVVFVGSDLGAGTLEAMKREFPERFFMEGICEQNVVGMAAGLAMAGFIPYLNTIATFLTRRCYEQVATDVCLHRLPVRLIASGGGLVYAPLGPTHLAIEDLAIMRALPGMTVVAPADAEEMRRVIEASLEWPLPMYVRFGKGGDPVVSSPERPFALGRGIVMREPGRVALVATGIMTERCLTAAALLEERGIAAGVVHLHTVKPLDAELVCELAGAAELLVTVEEHVLTGGLGSAVLEILADADLPAAARVRRLGLPDAFPRRYGSQASQLAELGLDAKGIAARVAAWLE